MTTTASRVTQLEATEVEVLDEAAITAAAQNFSRRLTGMTRELEARRSAAQARFDAEGLPRGLAG